MNKKFFLNALCAAMLFFAGTQRSTAQDFAPEDYDLIPESALITNASQLSSNASDEVEGTHIEYLIDNNINTFWHSDWHGKVSGDHNHYVQVALNEETTGYYSFVFGRRANSGTCQGTKFLIQQSNDGKSWQDIKTIDLPYGAQGEYCVSDIFRLSHSNHIRLTCKDTNSGTTTWHCAELQFYEVVEELAQESAINELLIAYDEYYWGNKVLDMGTGFGQYSDMEAYNFFMACLEKAMKCADGDLELTLEEINQLVEDTERAFAAILASKVTFSMPDGYYRIIPNLQYYTEVETDETDLDGNPITEREYWDAAMYSTLDGWCWWGKRDEKDARQLWQLSMVGKEIKMVNAATEMQCAGLKGGAMSMTLEADTLMAFDYVGQENDHDIFYIRFASVPAENDIYFHQWHHSKGAGTGSQLCTWKGTFNMDGPYTGDKGTSEWYLEPVSEDEAQALLDAFALVKDHDKLVLNYEELIEKSKNAIDMAEDVRNVWQPDTDAPVIETTSQFHSLWTEPNEGSLDNLLDGNQSTFWHSRWSSNKASGPHLASLDVMFDEPVQGNFQLYVLRRATDNNHITRLSVYGTNDELALEEIEDTNWELINSAVETPWTNGQKSTYSQMFTIGKPYLYLRFYEEDTRGVNGAAYTGCSHYGTFQLYPSVKVNTPQFETMGETATALKAIVDAFPGKDMAALTLEEYQELQKAYDDFMAMLVDPAELRNVIASNKQYPDYVVVGENPGFWTSDETAVRLSETLEAAQEYDHLGRYTKGETEQFIADIKAGKNAIFSSTIPVSTEKWYHLRFDSEDNFYNYGWDHHAAEGVGILYDQLIAAGVRPDGSNANVLPDYEIVPGTELFYFDNDQITNEWATQFRFVNLTDSTYAIQNRASGLFIYRNPLNESGGISLQNTPSAFTIKPIGYGQTIFYMTDINGAKVSNPHLNAWNNVNSLVATWSDSNPGCNSHLLIEPVEDIDLEDYSPRLTIARLVGDISPICLPYEALVNSGSVYQPIGCYEKDGEAYLALNVMEEPAVEAGAPFFVLDGGEYDGITTYDLDLNAGNKMTSEPKEVAGVVGTLVKTWLGTGYVIFSGNKTASVEGVDTGRNYNVPANSGYLKYGDVMITEDTEHDIAIQINGQFDNWDAIQNTISTVAKAHGIYNMGGQLVSKDGTLADVKKLGTGTYIIGGIKVMVK